MNKLLNLNIFYDPNYWLKHRKLINSDFMQSSFMNYYYLYFYRNNKAINNDFIKSGPQKLVNKILNNMESVENVVFNEKKFKNYYFVNFDCNNYDFVLEILKNKKNKLIIGPLYTKKDYLMLIELSKSNNNLKIVTASESAKNTMLQIAANKINSDKLLVLPVGINSESEILNFAKRNKTVNNDCLIYFKGRSKEELDLITNYLEIRKIDYKIFEYGKYKNSEMINYAKTSKFGLVLGRTESQGIAINEMMATNLPLLVFDSTKNAYEGGVYEGTTVPYWDKSCGEVIKEKDDYENIFQKFTQNLKNEKYNPYKYVIKNLSYESMHKNLEKAFQSF